MKTRYEEIAPYRTLDGSEIRELMHPRLHGEGGQSLAEARVEPGARTELHRHRVTEEIYHFTQGEGMMRLDAEEFPVTTGDTVRIPPGTPHRVRNTGSVPLRILCACTPAYSHEDTDILENGGG
ncbi:cupin domain-containing protein [Ectothiorhodospira mobilis]|uniref:Mannose-6-phosphate isomerase, cupin superfamily n=1 Tax=Ectothiorhodospira mobilis TaxID=195064 RepID=A0A1I4SP85_ECTMO|nr:cupin domain-containing protein [Ectothiorhodospira mobilis]MCG5536474.1 cupin domain-containing protein [Ectothiorhodospira mobilis]SFM66103.1 Mannose-6-phosphate isomerase, cupin superfamily [Ectothiorhodospira mobilis]